MRQIVNLKHVEQKISLMKPVLYRLNGQLVEAEDMPMSSAWPSSLIEVILFRRVVRSLAERIDNAILYGTANHV